jgi:hypothetical protein
MAYGGLAGCPEASMPAAGKFAAVFEMKVEDAAVVPAAALSRAAAV